MPEKKTETVRRLVTAGEYKKALSIAKGFRLGISPADSEKMKLAYECMLYPSFYSQLGKNTETEIITGIQVLKSLYGEVSI
jgi:hypothetical protein